MTFINALSGGLQAYAGSRGQGASAAAGNVAASAGAFRQRKPVRNATHCVGRDRQTGTGADYLSNSCDFKISVTWFSPEDSICRSGCAGDLKAHQPRSSVSKLKGRIVHAACEYPHSPKNPDGGRWTGAGQHICVGN